jgi:hypothetical protein
MRGWSTERIHDSETFCRLVIRSDPGTVLVDLAVNAPPGSPLSITEVGPTLAPEELAGHKLLALFDRAAARDFIRQGRRARLRRRLRPGTPVRQRHPPNLRHPDRRGLRPRGPRRHAGHPGPTLRYRDTPARRHHTSRVPGLLRHLAVRVVGISERLPECGSTPQSRAVGAMRGRFAAGAGDGFAMSLAGVPLLVAEALEREG